MTPRIDSDWHRIAGVHLQEDGEMGAVWLAREPLADRVHVYDCCVFKREVLAVIGEALTCRGRWIPVAWSASAKSLADQLRDRSGCNMLPEPCVDNPGTAEVLARDLWARMRSGRFRVDERLQDWLEEYRDFRVEAGKVPLGRHPLMAATRHAASMLQYARRITPPGLLASRGARVPII